MLRNVTSIESSSHVCPSLRMWAIGFSAGSFASGQVLRKVHSLLFARAIRIATEPGSDVGVVFICHSP